MCVNVSSTNRKVVPYKVTLGAALHSLKSYSVVFQGMGSILLYYLLLVIYKHNSERLSNSFSEAI